MKTKEKFRLPDGEWTTSAKKMSTEWASIYKPICKHFGVRIIGYNPKILFVDRHNSTFDIPVDIAIGIKDLIENATYEEKQL